MEEWLTMVKDVGFPIVVTLYLLHRVEGKLDEVNQSIQKLSYFYPIPDRPPSHESMPYASNDHPPS